MPVRRYRPVISSYTCLCAPANCRIRPGPGAALAASWRVGSTPERVARELPWTRLGSTHCTLTAQPGVASLRFTSTQLWAHGCCFPRLLHTSLLAAGAAATFTLSILELHLRVPGGRIVTASPYGAALLKICLRPFRTGLSHGELTAALSM